jgi:trehalose 6-phosphate phosphatase
MTDTASHSAVDDFAALDLASSALLLDIDGTLIDIGPSPFEVHVPEALCRSLARLLERMDGALALVSGRPIRDIDKLFSPLKLPAVGGHGAEMRLADGKVIAGVEALPDKLRKRLALAATPGSGVVIEDKGYSFALHYRQTPQQEPRLRALVERVRAEFPDEALEVLLGKAMFEIKRPGISKGEAVRRLMTHAPFAGRAPVFIGDDVTDESVFALMPALRGKGYSVGRHFAGLAGIFAAPDDVREALRRLASV